MRKVRENVLVTSGDQSVFPANTPVFICPTGGSDFTLNGILDGQLVFYDYNTGVSVGPGTTIDDVNRLVIAVGHDTNGDGVADVLRKPFGDSVFGCNIMAATAEPPRCGVPNIVDLYFKCVHCDENFGINITVEDDSTQNQYPFNRPATYNFSVNTGCCECDTCEDGIDCDLLACKFIDQINNTVGSTDARKSSVFTKLAKKKPNYPFYAVRLYGGFDGATKEYCLDPVVGACNDCLNIDAITGVSFTHPVDGATTVNFTSVVNPADNTLSLQAQLPRIVALINDALDGFGSATWTRSLDGSGRPCCSYQLQVNSCITDVELLDDAGDPIATCATSDPFTAITLENKCKECDDPTDPTYQPTCGIRIIAKPVEIDCDCELAPGTPRGYLGRSLNVEPVSGFACGSTYVLETQAEVLPENLGYEWQTREASNDNGGSGRGHNPWGYDPHGRWGAPLKNSRGYSHKAVCTETYCSYILEHYLAKADIGVHGNLHGSRGRTVILIPSGDTTTRTEFEAILNPYLTSSNCPVKQTITCASDQDQTEQVVDGETGLVSQDEYPNAGGGRIL